VTVYLPRTGDGEKPPSATVFIFTGQAALKRLRRIEAVNEPHGYSQLRILSQVATCTAQKLHVRRFRGTSEVGHTQGIDIQRVAVIEPNSEVKATVFIPDGSGPLAGIVFSHSAIHSPSNDTDLRRFAWALARAAAASIVLDGAIDWQSPNDESIRPPEFQFCAGQWLLQHVNLDLTRAADAGNHKVGWIDNDVSDCALELSGKRGAGPVARGWTSDKQGKQNRGTRMTG
jgi:hypothetical protein